MPQKLQTKFSIRFDVLEHMVISLEYPAAPHSSWAKAREKFCDVEGDVVIRDEPTCREELFLSLQIF